MRPSVLVIVGVLQDTEVASASVTVDGGAALNRVTWTQSGLHVAAGDDQGKVWVYDVGEQLAVPQPDEWNKFAHTLQVGTRPVNTRPRSFLAPVIGPSLLLTSCTGFISKSR